MRENQDHYLTVDSGQLLSTPSFLPLIKVCPSWPYGGLAVACPIPRVIPPPPTTQIVSTASMLQSGLKGFPDFGPKNPPLTQAFNRVADSRFMRANSNR